MKFKITQNNKRIFRVNIINSIRPNGRPTSLEVIALSDTRIDLSWTNGSTNEDGISIERSTDGINFFEIDTVGSGISLYSDTSCVANTLYYYRVRAFRLIQYSSYSNIDSDTTFETWFLEGGLSASNAKGAYFPLRSGSLANSYINHADGTKNAAPGVAPTFDNTNGWVFAGTQYLTTGLIPENDQTWTLIIRFSGATQPSTYKTLSGLYEAANRQVQIYLHDIAGSPFVYVANGGIASRNQSYTGENVIAITGNIAYLNYALMVITPATIPAGAGVITKDLYIGTNNYIAPTGFFTGNIQAWLLYDKVLSSSEYLRVLEALRSDGINTRYLSHQFVRLQFGAFVSFGMSTFCATDAGLVDGNVDTFNPADLDIDEWLDTFVTAGFRYASIPAKTEDGFNLYPTAFADAGHDPYGIGETAWYGTTGIDIVGAFVDGCKSRGIKPIIYYSMRDLTHEVRSGTDETTDPVAYIAMITTQLTEILTNYTDLVGIWLDDWNWHISYANIPYASIRNLIKSIQPNCLIFNNEHLHPRLNGDVEIWEVPSSGVVPVGNIRLSDEIDTLRIDGHWAWHSVDGQDAGDFDSKATINADRAQANSRWSSRMISISPDNTGHIASAQKALLESLQT